MGKNIGRMQMRIFLEEFVRRLPHMRLVPGQAMSYLSNTSFRGPDALWVEWEPAQNPERSGSRQLPPAGAFFIGPPPKASIARSVVLREKHAEGEGLFRLVLADPQGGTLPAWSNPAGASGTKPMSPCARRCRRPSSRRSSTSATTSSTSIPSSGASSARRDGRA